MRARADPATSKIDKTAAENARTKAAGRQLTTGILGAVQNSATRLGSFSQTSSISVNLSIAIAFSSSLACRNISRPANFNTAPLKMGLGESPSPTITFVGSDDGASVHLSIASDQTVNVGIAPSTE